jgi:hypothetical protein
MTQQALTAGVLNVRLYPLKSSRPESRFVGFNIWRCAWVCYSERCPFDIGSILGFVSDDTPPRARRWFSSRTIVCTSKNEFKNRFPLCHPGRVKRLQRYLLDVCREEGETLGRELVCQNDRASSISPLSIRHSFS